MAQEAEVIELLADQAGQSVHNEALSAAASAVTPGDLVEELVAGTVQEHGTAAANAQKLFALTNLSNGSDIDAAYAVGETVRYGAFHSGQEVFARVAAAAPAIVIGDVLESAGDGTVRKGVADAATDTAQRDAVVGYALEAVDNSGGGTVVRIKIRVA